MMRTNPTRLVLGAVSAALIACGGKDSATDTQNRPIDLAPAKQAQPALTDTPAPPTKAAEPAPKPKVEKKTPPPPVEQKAPEKKPDAPPAAAPAPAPVVAAPAPAPAPTSGTIAAGTSFSLTPATKICSSTHKVGDQFTATLSAPLTGTNNVEVPAGATAILRIVQASSQTKTDSAHLSYEIVSLKSGDQTYEVNAHVTQSSPLERVNSQSRTDAAKKVGAGALIGALAGRVLGGNTKGAVIGGAVGAAAGAAVAVNDNKVDGCLKSDGTITLALDKPLVVRLASAP